MLGPSGKEFKTAILQVVQQLITNYLETNGKSQQIDIIRKKQRKSEQCRKIAEMKTLGDGLVSTWK